MRLLTRKLNQFFGYVLDNSKKIIVNYLVFFLTIACLISIDLLTKHFLFIESRIGEEVLRNALFGIRIIPNYGLTFIKNVEAQSWILTTINILILLSCICSLLFSKHWSISMFIGFIFSGSLGNTVDRLSLGYVRDIIFLPWADKGTFNFADVDVVIGSIGLCLMLIIFHFLNIRRKK